MLLTLFVFILILGLLIFVHELGHFWAARRAGIRVEEFGFGLPPRIFGIKRGQTLYSLNLLPIGGFVKLVGEDPTEKNSDKPYSFTQKTVRARALVVTAGVLGNFFLAVILFTAILASTSFKFEIPLLYSHQFRYVEQENRVFVVTVEKDSPAFEAKIKPSELILSLNDQEITSVGVLQELIKANAGQEVTLKLYNLEKETTRQIQTTPRVNPPERQGALGVSLGEVALLQYKTLPQKVFSGFSHSINVTEYSFRILGGMIARAFETRTLAPVAGGVAGPVGILQITGHTVTAGFLSVLQLIALLSLNLAIINILPFPALDGGRLLFLGVEAATRRKLYPAFEKWAHTAGMAILLFLVVLITYNDIIRVLTTTALGERIRQLIP